MVETNYRIYAYTDSHLQIALLGLFTEVLYRFPNLCVGIISRDSCRQAFRCTNPAIIIYRCNTNFRGGITANQIIRFLNMHMMSTNKMSAHIPPTITDQIRLWEQERDRSG